MALVLPDVPPLTLLTERPVNDGVVSSVKLDAETPDTKVVGPRSTVTVAPFSVVSVSAAGFVAEIKAGAPKTLCADWLARALWSRLRKPPPTLNQLSLPVMELAGMVMPSASRSAATTV